MRSITTGYDAGEEPGSGVEAGTDFNAGGPIGAVG